MIYSFSPSYRHSPTRFHLTLSQFSSSGPGLSRSGNFRHGAVRDFLAIATPVLHAFELGALRGRKENRDVVELAQAYRRPVIAGGDRHGCEPSGLLNLTNAQSFSEFVEEVRNGDSHILAMPQYNDCTSLRVFHALLDVIRYYPDHPIGSRNWDERVFHHDSQGRPRPLSSLWKKPPQFITSTLNTLRLGKSEPIRRTLKFAFRGGQEVPRLELGGGQEAVF